MNTDSEESNRRKVEFDIDQAEIFLHLMAEIDDLIENHAAIESASEIGEEMPLPEKSEFALLKGEFLIKKWNQVLKKFILMYRTAKIYSGMVWSRFTRSFK